MDKRLKDLCDEISKTEYELIQNCYIKKKFTDNLHKYIKKKYKKSVYLTEEDKLTQQEIITNKELEHQLERVSKGDEDRDFREVAAVFQINRYFEKALMVLANEEFGLELYQNPRAYQNDKNHSREPDLLSTKDNNCYDIQGRTLRSHNKVDFIQIPEHKIKTNYKEFLDKYDNYYIIYYVIKGDNQILLQIVNINDCYKNNLFYEFESEQLKGKKEKYYRVNTDIQFKQYILEERNEEKMDERKRLHRLSYQDKLDYCKSVDIRLVLHNFNISPRNNNMFVCPFHDDHDASAIVYTDSNVIYCFAENKKYNIIDTMMKLGNVDFVKALDNIIDINLNCNKNNRYFEQTSTQITKKQSSIIEEKYRKTLRYCRTLEEIKEDEIERQKTDPGFKDALYELALLYFKKRGIDYEKCKNVLDLNHFYMKFGYFAGENSFYLDYNNIDGPGYIIQRHINKWVLPTATTKNQKFNIGSSVYKIIYTSNERKDREFYKNKRVVIVEGIMDALSLITMSKKIEDYVIVVLNSTSNLNQLFTYQNRELCFIEELDKYSKFTLCLDSDKTGEKATDEFIDKYIEITSDDDLENLDVQSLEIDGITFNDLNEYWIYLKENHPEVL